MLNTGDTSQLERLVEAVLAGAKYREISPELTRRIGARELAKRQSFKDAVKSTRNKLHQVGGAYLDGRENYQAWLHDLEQAIQSGDQASVKSVCKTIMSSHASTRERLPILEQFYSTLLPDLGPIHSILDLACGHNPLAFPWMPLNTDVQYYAYDIYQNMMDFHNAVFSLLHIKGHAQVCDIIQACPQQEVDIAFVLKTLPCLEQIDKQAGQHLLHALNARYILVSFPAQSLGGRNKGMIQYYEQHFRELIKDQSWEVQRHEFSTELIFIVRK